MKKEYKEIKLEVILVVDKELVIDDIDFILEDLLGNQQCEGIHGVAAARNLGSRDLGDNPYDEYPLDDDGDIWREWDRPENERR